MEPTRVRLGSMSCLRKSAKALLLLLALFGCTYGRLVLFPLGQESIETFVEDRYQGLEASYSGSWEKPGALRFGIKGGGILLTGSGWHTLESQEAILEIVRNMQNTYNRKYRGEVGARGPRLYTIMSDNNQPIGYIYSPIDMIPVRPDGKNYEVDAITELDVRNFAYPWRQPNSRNVRGRR